VLIGNDKLQKLSITENSENKSNMPNIHQKPHRRRLVENPGEGVAQVFANIPRGVKAFRKNCQGVPLLRVLFHFY
jgi:hypothetical protein